MRKNCENLAEWLQPLINEGTLDEHAPLLADTGTMKFEIIGMEIQHGGPMNGAVVLKLGNPVETITR
jgi:hypothetical protein